MMGPILFLAAATAAAPNASIELPPEALAPISTYIVCTGQEDPATVPAKAIGQETAVTAILKRCHAARQTAAAAEADRRAAHVPGYEDAAVRTARIAAYLDFVDERVRFNIINHNQAVAQHQAYERCLAEDQC
jgi:hypothetical protein